MNIVIHESFAKLTGMKATRFERREKIAHAETEARALAVMFPFEETAEHHFAPGLYARSLFMPAGSTVVGKIHRHAHIYVVSGHCWIYNEIDEHEVKGFEVRTAVPGEKRFWHVLADTFIVGFHPTTETDLEKIENDVIAKTYEVM